MAKVITTLTKCPDNLRNYIQKFWDYNPDELLKDPTNTYLLYAVDQVKPENMSIQYDMSPEMTLEKAKALIGVGGYNATNLTRVSPNPISSEELKALGLHVDDCDEQTRWYYCFTDYKYFDYKNPRLAMFKIYSNNNQYNNIIFWSVNHTPPHMTIRFSP